MELPEIEVAYLLNQYPMVSHTFIRREIAELERVGVGVHRLSIRGWQETVADDADRAERDRTYYLMKGGIGPLLLGLVHCVIHRPRALAKTIAVAARFGLRGSRGTIRTVATLLQACLTARRLAPCRIAHLHAHFGTNSTELALYTSILLTRPFSFTVHGPGEFDNPTGFRLADKVAAARFVVAITEYCASQIYRWVPVTEWPKIHVVHCGIQMITVTPPDWPGSRLVNVARLSPDKGHAVLLNALKQALQVRSDLVLTIVGDGELRGQLEQLATQLGVQDHVEFLGWRDEAGVRSAILSARALILTSFAEGLPIVIMEAFQCGRPVLATNVGAVADLVRTSDTGWLFSPGSIESAATAIIECVEATDEELEQRAARGSELVREKHDVARTAAVLEQLFLTGVYP